jgi:hypothetical protein
VAVDTGPTLAVFASDAGPGDPERASIMSQAGTLLARHKARIICCTDGTLECIPLVQSARAAGAEVLIVADPEFAPPAALSGVAVERVEEPDARLRRVGELAEVIVGLPGSLASASMLYRVWQRTGAGGGKKPLVLVNRNKAFEPVRGLVADVLSHSVPHAERQVVFTDTVEDLWNKVHWVLEAR